MVTEEEAENILVSYICKKNVFFRFESINKFNKACIDNIREKKLFNLIINNKETFLLGSFDLNTIIFYKKDIKWIDIILKETNLFLID